MKSLTKEKINKRLEKKSFVCISDPLSASTNAKFMCNICNYVWESKVSNVIYRKHTKCPECYKKNKSLSKKDILEKIKNRKIKFIGPYLGNIQKKHQWKCLSCNKLWKATVASVCYYNTGCPHCRKLQKNEINKRLKNKNVIIIKKSKNPNIKSTFKCLICKHEWQTLLNNILRRNDGCPQCKKIEIEKRAKMYLNKKNIILLSKYNSWKARTQLQCNKCGHKWKNSVGKVQGCPECCSFKNEKLTGTYLTELLPQHKIYHNKCVYPPGCKKKGYFKIDYSFNINNKTYFIEYNGEQHYKSVKFLGGNKKFIKQQDRDKRLKKYSKENNIILIEIDGRKYKEKKN